MISSVSAHSISYWLLPGRVLTGCLQNSGSCAGAVGEPSEQQMEVDCLPRVADGEHNLHIQTCRHEMVSLGHHVLVMTHHVCWWMLWKEFLIFLLSCLNFSNQKLCSGDMLTEIRRSVSERRSRPSPRFKFWTWSKMMGPTDLWYVDQIHLIVLRSLLWERIPDQGHVTYGHILSHRWKDFF